MVGTLSSWAVACGALLGESILNASSLVNDADMKKKMITCQAISASEMNGMCGAGMGRRLIFTCLSRPAPPLAHRPHWMPPDDWLCRREASGYRARARRDGCRRSAPAARID